MHSKTLKTKQIVSGVVALAMAFAFVLPAQAATVEELTAQINGLLGTIAALQSQLSTMQGGSSTPVASYTFTRDLKAGSVGEDVRNLQKVLNASADTKVAATGAGSPGSETTTFGPATKAAVIKFQNKFASEVLTPVGLTTGTGYVGAATRAKLNAMGGTSTGTGTGTGTVVTPTGATLAVAPATQPGAQLAPQGAARVPFTKFTLTAGSADVVVNSVTVTRVGPGSDAAFSGVVLVDENGAQIGLSKTLNSNHQANIGEPFTVKAGTTRTLTVAGNMAASLASYAGEVPGFAVSAINTSSPVVGSLPITGTGQTTNATLTIATVSMTEPYDPGAQNKSIGTTNYNFGTIKVTGSNEDIRLFSVRWNQAGSASASDLANVVTEVDGVKYPTTISADGKYYTTSFGNGIVIAKGFSKELSIRADIVGGPGRTVSFDVYRNTDLYLKGETYGYGITPPTTGSAGAFGTTNPWYNGSDVTVQAGSVTTIGKATEVAAQNIAANLPNQTLGGFATEFVGEPVTISGMVVTVATTTAVMGTGQLTNVTIVDQNGAVVAGPIDSTGSTAARTLTFSDSITFPTGRMVYTIKGQVPSAAANNTVITLTTVPSDWTTPTGQNTGNSVTISQGSFSMNAATVKTASLSITLSSQPVSQNIVAGSQDVLFANVQLDASQSGEDIRLSQIPLVQTGTITDITGCQLYDGSSVINTGSNVPTTLSTSGTDTTFTFDSPLTIPKGTVKTLALKCDVGTAASGNYVWSIDSADTFNATGITSGNGVTENVTSANSGTMSIASGSLAVSTDSSSPGYSIASSGAVGTTLGVAKFRATNDAVSLQRIGLKLTNAASSSASDLVQVTLWDGATQIGSAVFTGTNAHATSTLTTPITIAKDTDKLITIKGDLSQIGSSQAVSVSGHLVAVDVDSNTNTYGTGIGSGTTVNSTGSTAVAGVRVFKSYPTVAPDNQVSSNAVAGANVSLLRFKITAGSAGPVSIGKINTTLTTVSANATNLNLFAFTDSAYSQPISGVSTGGQVMAANQATTTSANTIAFYPQTTAGASTTIQIPAGATRWFEVRAGTVTGTGTDYSVSVTLNGDAAFPAQAGGLTSTSTTLGWIDGGGNQYTTGDRDFIWSPNSTTTVTVSDADWTNGYGLPGLPASGISHTRGE